MKAMRDALVFLTRVPVQQAPGDRPASVAVPWFPTVGLVIGALVGGIFAGGWHVLPPLAAAAVAITVGVVLTGALHLDGLGDVFDGFVGGGDRARRLEIMKDPRLGTYGVASLVLALVLQLSALVALGPLQGFVALVAAHGLGRSAAVVVMSRATVASEGLGSGYRDGLRLGPTLAGAAVPALVVAAAVGPWAPALIVAPLLPALLVVAWARRAIGGVNGDVCGAIEQVSETVVLLVAAALANNTQWPW